MSTSIDQYIAAFKSSEYISDPLRGFIKEGQPDPALLDQLDRKLAETLPEDREAIVDLLVKLGVETDPLAAKGAEVLRNQRIISILAGAGLAKADLGQYAALDALRKLVSHRDLTPHETAIVQLLVKSPSEEAFLLAAKVKPVKEKEPSTLIQTEPPLLTETEPPALSLFF